MYKYITLFIQEFSPRYRLGAQGLVVKGGDSLAKGCGFYLRHWMLVGHFSRCCKNTIVWLKTPKINEKDAVVGPF